MLSPSFFSSFARARTTEGFRRYRSAANRRKQQFSACTQKGCSVSTKLNTRLLQISDGLRGAQQNVLGRERYTIRRGMITIVGAMDAASKPMLAEAYETKSALVPSQPETEAVKRNEESSMQIDRPSHVKSGTHAVRSSRRATSLSHGSCTLPQQHCRVSCHLAGRIRNRASEGRPQFASKAGWCLADRKSLVTPG